jgi:membrane protease YdiL (CAAX protease family)
VKERKISPATSASERYRMQFRSFVPFLLISFGLAWSIIGLYVFLPERMAAVLGELTGNHPLFYLAVYSPAIAAFTLVARSGGLAGLRRFLGRALLWRCSAAWYTFLIIGIPLIFISGSAIRGNLLTEPFPFASMQAVFAALALAAIKGPMEEFGWRGFALPLLQRKLVPFWAGMILGVIWGLWHLPAFLLSGTQHSEWSFTAFFFGCLAISVIATALFNQSHGSILLSAFLHFSLMNPVFPDAQPYDTYILMVVAALIVWWNRKDMFTRKGAIVEVIPDGKVAYG